MAHVRERGGKFTITASLGYDETGKQVRKYTTFTPPPNVTPGKALKLANEYAVMWEDKIRGYVALDENRTFRELVEWFFDTVGPVSLKENIMIDDRDIVNTYLMPTLGREKLKNITPQMLDTLFRNLLLNGKVKQLYRFRDTDVLKDVKKTELSRQTGVSRRLIYHCIAGNRMSLDNAKKIAAYLGRDFDSIFINGVESRELAPSSVSRIRRCLSAIFAAAVRKEIMRRNPVSNTERIKRGHSAESFLDEQQAGALLTALDEQNDFQFKAMITTLLFTGMRGGELCGMKWDALDMDKGVIYIRATLAYNRGNKTRGKEKYTLQTPKTKRSERYVMIPASLIELLTEQRNRQQEKKAVFGSDWIERGTVFCTVNGDYYSEQYLNTKFKKLARKIGLPDDVHIHSLRHTTASLLINGGVAPKLVSEQMGHASTAITQDLYSHIFESSKVKAMQVLELSLLPQ